MRLDGADVWSLPEPELADFRCRHIGFVFQFPSLLSNLTAVDNIAVPALLGRTMDSAEVYARAYILLARVGLADRADAYPGNMSGGEQRRVVIARALINSPRLLLADEPTSDLDEDTEADIIDLLEYLQQRDSFALVLVTHNLELAKRALRTYEMRQGVLEATDLPLVAVEAESRPRHFGPAKILAELEPEMPATARAPIRLGANLWHGVQTLVLGGAVVFLGVLLLDFGVAKYQETQVRARGARIAKLAEMALSSLEGEVQSVSDLGDGRYELAVSLWNATGDEFDLRHVAGHARLCSGRQSMAGIAAEAD